MTSPSFEGSLYALTNALLGVLPATVLYDRSDMRGLATCGSTLLATPR
jgi:DEAD/DEAH box helicase domain-containing protein